MPIHRAITKNISESTCGKSTLVVKTIKKVLLKSVEFKSDKMFKRMFFCYEQIYKDGRELMSKRLIYFA